MQEAILANPYETHNSAAALDRALSMNLDERQLRMNQLKKRERRMDVDAWVRGFLEGMTFLGPISVPGVFFKIFKPLRDEGKCLKIFRFSNVQDMIIL